MNEHRTALFLFAALGVVVAVASVTTVERIHTRRVSNDAMPGTIGLAKPHPQLDRGRGSTRKTMIVALARKLLIALWRLITTGELSHGIVLRPAS
jgi:hypothetical protein